MTRSPLLCIRQVRPPVDLLDRVRTAYRHCRLVLTVPWVVEYLSMMDPIAAQLEHFQALLTLLVQVYRCVCRTTAEDKGVKKQRRDHSCPGREVSCLFLSPGRCTCT